MQKQTTLETAVSYTGIGLHSGREVHAVLKPAPADTGIVFVRTDLPGQPMIHAKAENVTSTLRATTVEENGLRVFTIEHLMSAFHAHRIDNAFVELDSEEPPVADGASLVFFELMAKAGVRELEAERREVIIDKVYRIDDEATGRFVMVVPYDGFRVSFTSLNPHKLIGVQYEDFHIDEETYHKEIAPARTIAYEKEIAQLREMGLGLGGTLESVIVYNDDGWLNPLHFEDELVRHKILDVIGDLRLAGIIRGHVIAAASGHALNTQLAKKIAAAHLAK
ncbi:UDP-3-O-acyl-N-acetylglucosamine deacetylase [uncultured Mitsuokella sp.]|uniref:UDP-3-O-acyl-N-acetylglucosamine deacetylase n=1 Tax=uncultured Mitsuokella sp. TaxID=453120 RepID=UPI000E4A7DB0|nr:UDP-3-O-acyl-N-acetylglucosamine deacetylase [Mitsuokella sp. AF21-1AC]RGS73684.1 UDP-3-O-[3-hydroxymyristoyl] N-acetylglucosamine deacetylase [Mitsuokella sp. AF21-1AC]